MSSDVYRYRPRATSRHTPTAYTEPKGKSKGEVQSLSDICHLQKTWKFEEERNCRDETHAVRSP